MPVTGVSAPGKTRMLVDKAYVDSMLNPYSKKAIRDSKIDELLNPSCPITEALQEMEWQEMKLKEKENED